MGVGVPCREEGRGKTILKAHSPSGRKYAKG